MGTGEAGRKPGDISESEKRFEDDEHAFERQLSLEAHQRPTGCARWLGMCCPCIASKRSSNPDKGTKGALEAACTACMHACVAHVLTIMQTHPRRSRPWT